MTKVNIAKLKNELSAYLRKVRAGAEILITERDEPIAKIVPLVPTKVSSHEEMLASLKREGVLEIDFSTLTGSKRIKRFKLSPGPLASEILIADRDR